MTAHVSFHTPKVRESEGVRVKQTLEAESLAGLADAARGRCLTLAVLAIFFAAVQPPNHFAVNAVGLAVFALLPWLQLYYARRKGLRSWTSYLFAGLDLLVMTVLLLVANPWAADDDYPQMMARFGVFAFYFMLLAGTALTYEPRLALATGIAAGVLWMLGALGQVLFLDSETAPLWGNSPPEILLDPSAVLLQARLNEAVAIAITGVLLAMAVARARDLVLSEAATARERANLARYFAPTVVDALSHQDAPLASVREQPVAVLFADIVGFTHLAEQESPQETIALLRDFHSRLEDCVFSQGGTLDKFLGDGLMATFGNPTVNPEDADNALNAARAMMATIGQWNGERVRAGQPSVQLSLGLHYGPVVIGNVGPERRLEWAVLGDTVNVASRLEGCSRSLGVTLVVSEALIAALHNPALAEGLRPAAPQQLRNREEPVAIRVV